MNPLTRERLFGFEHAFDHPVTIALPAAAAAVLLLSGLAIWGLHLLGKTSEPLHGELRRRWKSWLVLVPLMLGPILLGAAWTMLAVAILSLLCFREYARATGLFREKTISLTVVLGILAVSFAVFDHWYDFFVALFPLTVGIIAAFAILNDQPKGYIQRVALGILGFALFGSGLGHLGYMANDKDYRPLMILVLLAVEANDVFAFLVGKTLGRRKLAPNTSPNKTIAGALGAVVLTTCLVAGLGYFVFSEEELRSPLILIGLGMLISIVGQLGDLMLSSIKRDLGLKDTGATIPGHGGLLDRFDSLILVAPAVFHFVGFFRGFGLDEPTRIISGG